MDQCKQYIDKMLECLDEAHDCGCNPEFGARACPGFLTHAEALLAELKAAGDDARWMAFHKLAVQWRAAIAFDGIIGPQHPARIKHKEQLARARDDLVSIGLIGVES